MPLVLLPLIERGVRSALRRQGASWRMVSTQAGQMHVYDIPGTGSPRDATLVVMHGIGASASGFAPLLMRLRPFVKRILVPDYPGHGLSPEPTARLTVDLLFHAVGDAVDQVLGDEPCVVMGNSLGGAVALDYVASRASRVKGLVLLSPAGAQSSDEELGQILGAFGVKNRRDSLAFLSRVYHRPSWILRLVAHELPANLRRPGVSDLFGSISTDRTVPTGDLAKLTMPILLLWGRSERLFPASHLEWWRQHLPPQAVIEEPEEVGHCPHVDAPGPIARRVGTFLREHATMTE